MPNWKLQSFANDEQTVILENLLPNFKHEWAEKQRFETLRTLKQEDVGLAVTLLQRLLVFYRYLFCNQVNKVFA